MLVTAGCQCLLYIDHTVTLRKETNFETLWECANDNSHDISHNQNV